MQKRGMVAVFIIVGLFILLVSALVVLMYQGVLPGPDFLQKNPDSVTKFTEGCIENVARQGLAIMSVQGGYIKIPDENKFSFDKPYGLNKPYIDMGFKVPYWFDSGTDKSPTIYMMEKELSGYIDSHLEECLNGYEGFAAYDINVKGVIKSDVAMTDKLVSVKTNYPMSIKPLGKEEYQNLNEFNKEIKTNYVKMFNLAKEILNYENNNAFLENYTDEMIAASDYLPYEGMDISCSPKMWLVSDMKKYTQTLIMHNLNFLMFQNTHYQETGMPYYDKLYKIGFTRNNYNNFDVNVIYNPSWGMEYEVTPSDGQVVKPMEFSLSKIFMSCIKMYHHKYTLEYPVMITVTDLENPDDSFMFATPVIMKRNLPNRYLEVLPWPTEFDKTGNSEFCANTSKITVYDMDSNGNMYTIPSLRENRRYSQRVYVRDALTGKILPDVNISYQCVNFRCDIGSTKYPKINGLLSGAEPILNEKFPDCIGGLMIAEKQGYKQSITQATVAKDTNGQQVIMEMYPLKKFNYRFKVIEDRNGVISERELASSEFAIMDINYEPEQFKENIYYPSEYEYFNDLELMVGDFVYDLDIKLVSDTSFLGGMKLNWTVSAQNLMNSNQITFYIVKKKTLLDPQSQEEFQELIDYALENSNKYPPKFN